MLILPSANRVYAAASVDLVRAELAAFSDAVLGGMLSDAALSDAALAERGGVPYLEFTADELDPRAICFLANVSGCYALFEVTGDGLLRPVGLHRLDRYDDDLITIQKYPGKTNEQFTKLLLNVTLMASAFAGQMIDRKLSVLDPLCGRGTTLNQALMYGYDAAGIEQPQPGHAACPAAAGPAGCRRARLGGAAAAGWRARRRAQHAGRAPRRGGRDPGRGRPGAGRHRSVPAVSASGRPGHRA